MSDEQTPGATPDQEPTLPPKPKGKGPLIAAIAVVAALVILAIVFLPRLFGNDDTAGPETSPAATDDDTPAATEGATEEPTEGATEEGTGGAGETVTVTLGTTDASQGHWPVLQALLAEEGIELELVSFSEYTQPNPALAQGQIDLNAFQHFQYLANHLNANPDDDLVVIAPTLIVPLPLYSNHATLEDIPDGGEIAIPNDTTNQARALFVLQDAGLITLNEDHPSVPTPADVDTANSRVTVQAVEASQTARLVNELDGAIVNNNFALDAGFDPESYLFASPIDSESAEPYINIIVARGAEADRPEYQRVAELYHDPSVTDIVVEESGNSAIIVDGLSQEELADILERVREDLASS